MERIEWKEKRNTGTFFILSVCTPVDPSSPSSSSVAHNILSQTGLTKGKREKYRSTSSFECKGKSLNAIQTSYFPGYRVSLLFSSATHKVNIRK
jgi:hypothetical protein